MYHQRLTIVLCSSYIVYLTFTSIALRRHRRAASLPQDMVPEESQPEKRFKLASNIYTDIDVETNSLPSTLNTNAMRSGVMSPGSTTHPPSYITGDGHVWPVSRPPSTYLAHRHHDSERGSTFSTSRLCNCACHMSPHAEVEELLESNHAGPSLQEMERMSTASLADNV